MPTDNNTAGRITLALIASKIDSLDEKLTEHIKENREQYRETEMRLRNLENWQGRAQTEITNMNKDICDMQLVASSAKQQSEWWNGANSIGVLIATIIGWFK